MIWFLLQKIGFWIFVILTIYFVYRRKTLALLKLFFWGMTFATCYQFAITIWFPTKVIVLGMMICMYFYGEFKRSSSVTKVIMPFLTVFFILILIGDAMAYLLPGDYAKHINKFSRIFNTNYTYITQCFLLFYGCMMPRGFVKKVYPSYCLAMEVAIGFGIIHYLCLQLGIEFMPILRQNGVVNLEALADVGGEVVSRIYGVSGEPKNLGFLVCPYTLLLIVMYGQGHFRYNKPTYHLFVIAVGIFTLINTYSSAVIINFVIASTIIFIFLPTGNLMRKLGLPIIGLIISWGLYSYAKDGIAPNPQDGNFISALYDRSFGRAEREMSGDRQERVILDSYFEDPNILSKIVGYGPAQYTFHIKGQTIGNALIPVQSGLVLTLVDFGMIGICLLCWIFLILFQVLRHSFQAESVYGIAFSIAALSSFIGSLMFGSLTSCFIYLMLALYAYYDQFESEVEEEFNYLEENGSSILVEHTL